MTVKKYPCVYMRGGTSKAVFFHEKDLPADRPFSTGTWASITLPVFTLKIRTTVTGSTAGTSPSSMAKGPTAEEMFPQLRLSDTEGWSILT